MKLKNYLAKTDLSEISIPMASFSDRNKGQDDLIDRVVYIVGPDSVQNELLASLLREETRAVCLPKENIRDIEALMSQRFTNVVL